MKLFRKKNVRTPESGLPPAKPGSEPNFYVQRAGESPLDEYFDGSLSRQTHRTSRHSAARRRENSNRASSWAIGFLLMRAVLIVVLLVGGFVVLKLVLNRMAEPSEKEKQRWEARAVQMEAPAGAPAAVSAGTQVPQELVVTPVLVGQKLGQWEQAERFLRSAEALERRGIDEEAIQRLGQALHIMPDNREAQQLLVAIYMRRGLYAEAVPLCVRLLDQDSQREDLQMNLLQALQGSGQIAAGLVLADRLLQDQPNNGILLSISAAGQIALGNKEAALALFKRMLESDDKNKIALEGCGKIYFDQNDYSNAVPYYLELVRLDSKPENYQMLARCYAQQNQAGKTVIFMGQAASLFGEATVSPWLKEAGFDPVRETVEFRSFADRVVGVETRKAIEAINKREAEKKAAAPGGLELPQQPDLQAIRPGK